MNYLLSKGVAGLELAVESAKMPNFLHRGDDGWSLGAA